MSLFLSESLLLHVGHHPATTMEKNAHPSRPLGLIPFLTRCTSYLYTFRMHEAVCNALDSLHTYWLSRHFFALGDNCMLRRPIRLVGANRIACGDHSSVGKGSALTVWNGNDTKTPALVIGKHTHIGEYAHITCSNAITIGDHVLTGKGITISDNAHGDHTRASMETPPMERETTSKGPVNIGNNVWIADKVTILANVTIGDNAVIGANSVVTSDIPANAIAVGIPAKVIRQL